MRALSRPMHIEKLVPEQSSSKEQANAAARQLSSSGNDQRCRKPHQRSSRIECTRVETAPRALVKTTKPCGTRVIDLLQPHQPGESKHISRVRCRQNDGTSNKLLRYTRDQTQPALTFSLNSASARECRAAVRRWCVAARYEGSDYCVSTCE